MNTALTTCMAAIAKHLPGAWTQEDPRDWITTLHRTDDDLRITARADGQRILLFPAGFRSEKYPAWYIHNQEDQITIGARREPAAAAADIARRLLPAAERWSAKGRAYIAEAEQREDAKAAAVARIAAVPGAHQHTRESERVHGRGWTATVSAADSVRLEIRGVDVAAAVRALVSLAGALPARPGWADRRPSRPNPSRWSAGSGVRLRPADPAETAPPGGPAYLVSASTIADAEEDAAADIDALFNNLESK